jgi:hypothetical protein
MAEAASLALAAMINDLLNFNNTIFLLDCQKLVQFLNTADQSNPPEWRIKLFTQLFANCPGRRGSKIFKISRNFNTTADSLVKQAFNSSAVFSSSLQHVCTNSAHFFSERGYQPVFH